MNGKTPMGRSKVQEVPEAIPVPHQITNPFFLPKVTTILTSNPISGFVFVELYINGIIQYVLFYV